MQPLRHRIIREYDAVPPAAPSSEPPLTNLPRVQIEPDWLIAVFGVGRQISWNRATASSAGDVTEGALARREKPLLLDAEVTSLQIRRPKGSPTKTLSATLRGPNFLDPDLLVPGDWVMAWCFNNTSDRQRVRDALLAGKPANGFMDGLRFAGRAHAIRKRGRTDPGSGTKRVAYSLQAIGFSELDTTFCYDLALGTASEVSGDVVKWMAQVGIKFNDLLAGALKSAGNLRDNAGDLIAAMFNIILGRGGGEGNAPSANATDLNTRLGGTGVVSPPQPQFAAEAPAAYLVPRGVGLALGRTVSEASKDQRVFGYSDICDLLVGTQKFEVGAGFNPDLDTSKSTPRRRFCQDPLKGTILPVNLAFVNQSVWSILCSYLNSEINEIYTALRVGPNNTVVPTVVARQIPFSTQAAVEPDDWPITRHLERPRWVVDAPMVRGDDLGRSDATRCNYVHVYGQALAFASNKSETNQIARNPPLFDQLDIQRSGIRAHVGMVACALADITARDEQTKWLAAIADWRFGSHLTLNGTLECCGIQSPVAEGDALEWDGVVYEIESISDDLSVDERGNKTWRTVFELSNGMPVDQTGAVAIPAYPGFTVDDVDASGDPDFLQGRDPGQGGT